MTMLRRWTVGLLIGLAVVGGCAQYKIRTDYDRGVDFTALRTFGWRPGPQKPTGDPRFDNPIIDASARGAVERALADKGYTMVAEGSPDFLVGYDAVLTRKTDVATFDRWYGYRGGGFTAPHLDVRSYEEGTLLIDVVAPGAMELLWRGSATGIVFERVTAEKRAERVEDLVDRILAKFPPDR